MTESNLREMIQLLQDAPACPNEHGERGYLAICVCKKVYCEDGRLVRDYVACDYAPYGECTC